MKCDEYRIPFYYGGIDRIYGDISIESADKILDIVDLYVELVESISEKETSQEEINEIK